MHISRPVSIFLILLLCFAGFYFGSFSTGKEKITATLPEPEIHIPATTSEPESPTLHAMYACLMDGGSGRVLFQKDAGEKAALEAVEETSSPEMALPVKSKILI